MKGIILILLIAFSFAARIKVQKNKGFFDSASSFFNSDSSKSSTTTKKKQQKSTVGGLFDSAKDFLGSSSKKETSKKKQSTLDTITNAAKTAFSGDSSSSSESYTTSDALKSALSGLSKEDYMDLAKCVGKKASASGSAPFKEFYNKIYNYVFVTKEYSKAGELATELYHKGDETLKSCLKQNPKTLIKSAANVVKDSGIGNKISSFFS